MEKILLQILQVANMSAAVGLGHGDEYREFVVRWATMCESQGVEPQSVIHSLVAVGDVERGELVPHRVFHLGGTAARNG